MTEEIIEKAAEGTEVIAKEGNRLVTILTNKKVLIGAAVVSAGALVCTAGKKLWDKFHKKDVIIPEFASDVKDADEESEEVEG